jgi:integral membrane sensor domain MASE1
MMNARMTEEGEGVRAARARSRQRWRTTGLAILAALGIDVVLLLGKTAPGQMRPTYAIAAAVAMIIVLPLAVHFNNRTKDELDRLNSLRANSLGLFAFLVGGFCWSVLFYGGLVPAPNVIILMLATAVVTLGRYLMLKMGR